MCELIIVTSFVTNWSFLKDIPKNEISRKTFMNIFTRSHSSLNFFGKPFEDFKKKIFYEDFVLKQFLA